MNLDIEVRTHDGVTTVTIYTPDRKHVAEYRVQDSVPDGTRHLQVVQNDGWTPTTGVAYATWPPLFNGPVWGAVR